MDDDQPVVLVVEDDEDLADTYAHWLGDEYDVRTACDGANALEAVSPAVDVVLLDRRIPGMPADEVLERIRERDLDCRVSILATAEPGPDIVELPFDEYLVEPVGREELRETVVELRRRNELDDELQEYMRLSSTLATLEADGETEEVEEIREAVEARREEAEKTLSEMGFEQAFREV